jgi:hypothetical protein
MMYACKYSIVRIVLYVYGYEGNECNVSDAKDMQTCRHVHTDSGVEHTHIPHTGTCNIDTRTDISQQHDEMGASIDACMHLVCTYWIQPSHGTCRAVEGRAMLLCYCCPNAMPKPVARALP